MCPSSSCPTTMAARSRAVKRRRRCTSVWATRSSRCATGSNATESSSDRAIMNCMPTSIDASTRSSPITPIWEIYSIDESFFRLPVLPDGLGNVVAAHAVREDIARSVGLPTRIGLGPTRTLSKVANALAKATEKVWGGVVDLHDVELRRRLFDQWPVGEVWGIGHALAARLRPLGVQP